MEEKGVVLLLLKVSHEPVIAHKLIWILTRKFEIFNYLDVLNECVNEGTIERLNIPTKEMGSYSITDLGFLLLDKMLNIGLIEKLSEKYENHLIELLKG